MEYIKSVFKKKEKLTYFTVYTLIMLLMCFVVFSYFILQGKSLIWREDGLFQHYISLRYYRDYIIEILKNIFIKHEFLIPMWDFTIGQGSDIITTLHYYVIGDPLTLLSVFFKPENIEICYIMLIILRLYLSGIAFSIFCFYFNMNKKGVLAGAISYIFCGYAIYASIKHPYFINPMIYLPLVLLGAEKILKNQKPYLFIFMVFISSISNFYFLYVIILMIIIYTLIRYYCLYKKEKLIYFIKCMLKFLLYGIIGILLSAVILLPVIGMFLSDVRENVSYDIPILYSIKYYIKFLSSLFNFGSVGNWSFLGYTPIALIAVYTLFVNKKEDKSMKIGIILLTIFLMFPIFGHVLNGFSYITNRWVWAYSFVICVIISSQWENIFLLNDKQKKTLMILIVGYVILYLVATSIVKRIKMKYIFALVMLLYSMIIIFKTKHTKIKQFLILLLILVSITLNSVYQYKILSYTKQFVGFRKVENILKNNSSSGVLKKEIKNIYGNKEFYRYAVSSKNRYQYNDSVVNGLNGVGYYFSMQNGYISNYLYEMNNLDYRTNYKYRTLDDRTALNELASVKYFIEEKENKYINKNLQNEIQEYNLDKSDNIPYGYEKIKNINKNKRSFNIYENKYSLPLGYSYDNYILRDEYDKLNSVEKQEMLLKRVLLEKTVSDYNKNKVDLDTKKVKYELASDNKDVQIIKDNEIKVNKKNAKIDLKFNGVEDAEMYLELIKLDFKPTTKRKKYNKSNRPLLIVSTDNVAKKVEYHDSEYQFYNGRENFTVNLGYSKKSRNVITIKFKEKGIYGFNELNVIFQPMKNYKSDVEKLKQTTLENVNISTNHITGTVTSNKDKILLLSIPYNGGWSAKIDNEDVEVYRANSMYMAVGIKKGNHKIDLYYTMPYIKEGAVASGIGIIIMFIIIGYRGISKNKYLENKDLLKS